MILHCSFRWKKLKKKIYLYHDINAPLITTNCQVPHMPVNRNTCFNYLFCIGTWPCWSLCCWVCYHWHWGLESELHGTYRPIIKAIQHILHGRGLTFRRSRYEYWCENERYLYFVKLNETRALRRLKNGVAQYADQRSIEIWSSRDRPSE